MEVYALDVEKMHELIRWWRQKRDEAAEDPYDTEKHSQQLLISKCYIDAYQSVLKNHGAPMLHPEEGEYFYEKDLENR